LLLQSQGQSPFIRAMRNAFDSVAILTCSKGERHWAGQI
jgi:hypothetical protein